jgi:hypothetical protein
MRVSVPQPSQRPRLLEGEKQMLEQGLSKKRR